MTLYFVKDKKRGIYFVQEGAPFFYSFSDYEKAVQFCNSHPGTTLEEQELPEEEDKEYIMECLYQKGYKGGYQDGVFCLINQTNPELLQWIPEQAGLLHLVLFQETHKVSFLRNQRMYFFATVTEGGYLAFANTEEYIFGFTDIENMDTRLAKYLYQKGYEVVKYYMDEKHKYLINPQRSTQIRLEEGFSISGEKE